MNIIEDIEKIKKPFDNAVVTIGNFDGVHLGHQALFNKVLEKAGEINGTSITITFEPHPIKVLKKNGGPPLITLCEQKTELILNSGIDVLICIPFTKKFSSLTAMDFIEDLLVNRIGMKAIVIGEDYTFGKNREGDIHLLKKCAPNLGFEVIVPDLITPESKKMSDKISSTIIRKLVIEGQVENAENMLGRYYQIRGRVIKGRDRGGRLLGIPTANIVLSDELCPKSGVYAVYVECRGNKYKGVANIGYSPTFDDHMFTVEVHILDFNENIYDEKIRVNFVKRLRGEKKFSGIDELSSQIKKDIERARTIII